MPHLAFTEATRQPITSIARELQGQLGQRLVAYAAGIRSPRLVARWAAEDDTHHKPNDNADRRLRDLFRTVLILRGTYGPETIRAWLVGANPDLKDRAPIELIREDDPVPVFHAAEAFCA
jgi:hypothetical protein